MEISLKAVMYDKLNDIENSHKFLSSQYEAFKSQVGNLMADNSRIKAENEKLVAPIRNIEKDKKLKVKAIDDLEQHGKRDMVHTVLY